MSLYVIVGGVIVLAIGPMVHRFKPGRDYGFFKGDKILYDFFWGGGK
jgi:hypothetical protein